MEFGVDDFFLSSLNCERMKDGEKMLEEKKNEIKIQKKEKEANEIIYKYCACCLRVATVKSLGGW